MPIYEYLCTNPECSGYQFDELQTMSEPPLKTCPKCGKDTLKRLIGAGSGVIFKGSGFYGTDYKKEKRETSKVKSEKDETKQGESSKMKDEKESKQTKKEEKNETPDESGFRKLNKADKDRE